MYTTCTQNRFHRTKYFPDTNQLTELKFPMTNNGDDDTDNQVVFTLLENEILPSELQT